METQQESFKTCKHSLTPLWCGLRLEQSLRLRFYLAHSACGLNAVASSSGLVNPTLRAIILVGGKHASIHGFLFL